MICCNDIINYKKITLLRIFKTMYKYNEGNCNFMSLTRDVLFLLPIFPILYGNFVSVRF